ncbi:MAG: hypothetical protein LBS49_04610, partial [Candidatus Accumulibacter sp.]|nr:hypothetical protein [Accumulibacter sp.]
MESGKPHPGRVQRSFCLRDAAPDGGSAKIAEDRERCKLDPAESTPPRHVGSLIQRNLAKKFVANRKLHQAALDTLAEANPL